MTPEEKAVIQAAIEWRNVYDLYGMEHAENELLASANALLARQAFLSDGQTAIIRDSDFCPECLTDPTEDPAPWCDCRSGEMCKGPCRKRAHAPARCPRRAHDGDPEDRAGDTEPSWWVATFADLLPGDLARIGTMTARVTKVHRGQWHARGREWIDDAGKVRDHMTPWEHEELRIDLTANPGMHVYSPDTACEILADSERVAVLALQAGFPGTQPVDN